MNDPRLPMIIPRTCNRCGRVMNRQSESYFTDEIICPVCVEWEIEIKSRLEKVEVYEKIGFVPKIK